MSSIHVKEFIRDVYPGRSSLSGNGKEFNVPCPFHDDRKAKKHAYINIKTGMWICFRCDEHGGFVRFARKALASRPDLKLHDYVIFDGEGEAGASLLHLSMPVLAKTPKIQPLPAGYLPVWLEAPGYEEARKKALAYLDSRGVSVITAHAYEIGFATIGQLRGRVIVPVRAVDSRLVGWVARDLTGEQFLKILSSSNEVESIKNHIFGLDKAQYFSEIVVVEGVFDAMRHGPNFVALLGKNPTAQQIAVLLTMRAKGITKMTVLLDADASLAAKFLAGRLVAHIPEVYVATLLRSKDPGEAPDEEITEVIENANRYRI